MNDKDIEKRCIMLNTWQKKKYSAPTRIKILSLFPNYKESEKEALAEKITKIIEASKTEQEALEQILKLAKQE